ncbi:hypothetical protein GCM10010182_74670 [Actinomadura cremea]|nr:hypothetical protein GCM10010182_74670 [Actinomadura cremea]
MSHRRHFDALPGRCFGPLDLDDLIGEVYTETEDAAAVRDVLAEALLDPRARGDEAVFDYACEYVEFIDDDASEAVAFMTRLIEAHPGQRFALGALRASLREPGDAPAARREIAALREELQRTPRDERDPRFYLYAPEALAAATGDDERGGALAAEGMVLATDLGRPDLAREILMGSPGAEHRALAQEHMEAELAELMDDFPGGGGVGATTEGKIAQPSGVRGFRLVYLPEAEYARAMTEGLLDASYPARHEDHRRETQTVARENSDLGKVQIAPLDIGTLRGFAEREGLDPARRSTRLAALHEVDRERDVPWPPGRNDTCWCGTGRKYKKCCGRPGFDREEIPDRGRAVLRAELDGTDPLVWRRVAVPTRMRLDALHTALVSAMGWDGDGLYSFEIQDGEILDPRVEDAMATADENALAQLANEPGQSFTWRVGDWTHTVRLEEIVEEEKEPGSAGEGACPPIGCGGVSRYRWLLQCLRAPDDPGHEQAVRVLGPGWDPAGRVPAS